MKRWKAQSRGLAHGLALGLVLGAASLGVGCSSEPAPAPDLTCSGAAAYAVDGEFAAGVTTLDVDGVLVEVWYPVEKSQVRGKKKDVYDMRDWLPAADRGKISDADAPRFETNAYRDMPVKQGKYPLVLFSHGLGGYRSQSTVLTAHLATWGFIVAAPEHKERNLGQAVQGLGGIQDKAPEQLRAALARLLAENGNADSAFAGSIDTTRIMAMGHSMGGAGVSDIINEDSIKGSIFLASGGVGQQKAGKSLLMVGGTRDGIAKEANLELAFSKQPEAVKRLVFIRDAGHLAFTDLCAIARDRGGVLGVAKANGINVEPLFESLAKDGCLDTEGDLPVEKAWPVINHYVTAHLRLQLGIDTTPRALEKSASECFGNLIATYSEK